MTMLPGQRRPGVTDSSGLQPARAAEPPLPPGWTRVTHEAPPASWTGLPRPQINAEPRTSPAPYDRLPGSPGEMPAAVPAGQRGTLRIQLGRNAKIIVTAIGMLLTVLMLIDGIGLVSSTNLRDTIAIIIAALTPIAVAFIPDWKPPKTGGET